MKTRMAREIQRKLPPKKEVEIKLKINKFINPSRTYRLLNVSQSLIQNFFVREEVFFNQVQKYSPRETLFEYNKIIKGNVEGDFIKFTMIPIQSEFEFNNDYVIERLLSFGDQKAKQLAQVIKQLKKYENCITDLIEYLPRQKDLLSLLDKNKGSLVIYDDLNCINPRLNGCTSYIYVSLPLMRNFGWTDPQQYILDCLKNGKVLQPFLIKPRSSTQYSDRVILKVKSALIDFDQCLQQKSQQVKLQSQITQLSSQVIEKQLSRFEARVIEHSQLYNDRSQKVKFKFLQSPFSYTFQQQQVFPTPISKQQLTQILFNDFQDQHELQLIENLVPISQNKLKRYEDKVCSYKSITKDIVKLQPINT